MTQCKFCGESTGHKYISACNRCQHIQDVIGGLFEVEDDIMILGKMVEAYGYTLTPKEQSNGPSS